MSGLDDWDVVALVFCILILALIGLTYLVSWINAHNPMHHTRRMIDGRKAMATDWRRPQYLPEDWQ